MRPAGVGDRARLARSGRRTGRELLRGGRDRVVRQPANTFSNVGFVAAGLLIAWHAGVRANVGASLSTYRYLATAIACLVVLLGPGSAAMHATQSALGGHLDMLSMYLVASFAAAYAVMRWLRGGSAAAGGDVRRRGGVLRARRPVARRRSRS